LGETRTKPWLLEAVTLKLPVMAAAVPPVSMAVRL
jgi:hypothetical protein